MTPEEQERALARRKLYKRVALAGFVLGLLCKFLPPAYQAPCELIVHVCTVGGF